MNHLIFSDIKSFNSIIKLHVNQRPKYGVYVWGFKFNDVDPFIPYYVGEVGGRSKSLNSKANIYSRLIDHYNFKDNYHVIKGSLLNNFNGFILTDAQIGKLSKNQFSDYEMFFDYLNIVWDDLKKKYVAKNNLKQQKVSSVNIKNSIAAYQKYFYACWIEYPVEEVLDFKSIFDLEKFVHHMVKQCARGKNMYPPNGFKLIGKTLSSTKALLSMTDDP